MTDFQPHLDQIAARLDGYRQRGSRMFSTSSFQTNSVVLLHIISTLAPEVPVYFLNTGFCFAETLEFRDSLAARLGLTVRQVSSPVPRLQQRDERGRLLFASDPDFCCHLNKVAPLEPVLHAHDVWINGVRASQSETRAAMKVEQHARHGTLRFHPVLKWTSKMVWEYRELHDLPAHPLEAQGYFSIGCQPCTRRPLGEDACEALDDRSGRWSGLKKTECGLHTDLAEPGT